MCTYFSILCANTNFHIGLIYEVSVHYFKMELQTQELSELVLRISEIKETRKREETARPKTIHTPNHSFLKSATLPSPKPITIPNNEDL